MNSISVYNTLIFFNDTIMLIVKWDNPVLIYRFVRSGIMVASVLANASCTVFITEAVILVVDCATGPQKVLARQQTCPFLQVYLGNFFMFLKVWEWWSYHCSDQADTAQTFAARRQMRTPTVWFSWEEWAHLNSSGIHFSSRYFLPRPPDNLIPHEWTLPAWDSCHHLLIRILQKDHQAERDCGQSGPRNQKQWSKTEIHKVFIVFFLLCFKSFSQTFCQQLFRWES